MKLLISDAFVYDSGKHGFCRANILCENGLITRIEYDSPITDTVADVTLCATGKYVVPGFVDIHTHGRAGYDFCNVDEKSLAKLRMSYAGSGVTSLFATLASAPVDDWISSIKLIEKDRQSNSEGAVIEGIHLEGNFINPAKRGIHRADLLVAPNVADLQKIRENTSLPIHLTYAPELDTDGSFAKAALSYGMTLAAGHTCATYAEAKLAEERGVTCYTHTFNAMPPLHHRDGGPVAAALTGHNYFELICDGHHIAPQMIKLAYLAGGLSQRIVLVTDSIMGAGAPDGKYTIAGEEVTVKDGLALSADGTIGGSTLDLYTALRNFSDFTNFPLEALLPCVTTNPASAVGVGRIGRIAVGYYADFNILARDTELCYRLSDTVVRGNLIGNSQI